MRYRKPDGRPRGQAFVNLLSLSGDEKVCAVSMMKASEDDNGYLLMATRKGQIKKTARLSLPISG